MYWTLKHDILLLIEIVINFTITIIFVFKGIRLLSYLFELARDNISSSHYLVLLSFLQSSCQPYFLYVDLISLI